MAELIWRKRWDTRRQAEGAIFQYINRFYNLRRRHLSLGGKSPWHLSERLDTGVERPEPKRDKTS
jgi:transposase InsO family protein